MASRTTLVVFDDLDGRVLTPGNGRTVRFSFEGVDYEIDLANENRARLFDVFRPFTAAARRIDGPAASTSGVREVSSTRANTRRGATPGSAVGVPAREWLRDRGYDWPDDARLPAHLLDLYIANC